MTTENKMVQDEALANAMFDSVKPELAAFRPDELLVVNLDISAAVATVLGVLPEVRALRPQIVSELPTFDIQRFDKLEAYALALSFAHAKFLAATQPPDDLDALSLEASRVRERLLAEARALVHHSVISDSQLAQLKGANGYKNIATDLLTLTHIMQTAWPQIQGKTPTTQSDLETASRLATRLLRVIGLREQGPAQIAEATDDRLRAYTLLLLAYDDARRAVAYLRSAQDDADDIAPALHPGRPRSRKGEAEKQPATVPGTTTTPGGAVPGTNPANGSAVAAPVAPPAAPTTVAQGGPFMS